MSTRADVVLPYRDAAETIEEAIASVLVERDVELAVIAVDDGSRDASAEVVARLAARDRRVRPIAGDGRGLISALEIGRRAGDAPFVARMDADDVSLPGRIAREVALLEAEPRLGVAGVCVEAFPGAAIAGGMRAYVAWQNALITGEQHARAIFVESPVCHPAVTIRRAALDAVGGWREAGWAEDYDLWLRLHAAGWEIAKVPEVLFRWRHREGRATFTDPRYAPERFRQARAAFLAPLLRARGRAVAVWGAGPTGRRLARALEAHGIRATRFVDIDPRKIGRQARGAPIVGPEGLTRGEEIILIAVGTRGARDLVRAHLDRAGFAEGDDYIACA